MLPFPKAANAVDFTPMVREAMVQAYSQASTQGIRPPFTVTYLMTVVANSVCPGIDWSSYGTRKFGPGGGEGLNALWMFSFVANRLVKDGIFTKDGDRYRLREAPDAGKPLTETLTSSLDEDLPLDEAPEAAAAITVNQKGGVSLNLGSFVFAASGAYHGDVFLSRIAAEQTACFGGWSSEAKPCKNCHLAQSCFQKSLMALSRIGEDLDKGKPATPVAAASQPKREEKKAPREIPGTTVMSVPIQTVCEGCRKAIKENETARSKKGFGMYHLDCYDSAHP